MTPQELETGLRDAVAGRGAVVDVSGQHYRAADRGARPRRAHRGCSTDLHPAVFRRAPAAQTVLGRTGVMLLALDDTGTSYDIVVRSSFAQYLATWLLDAAVEHQT